MEPLAHTLTGACLAESGLKRITPLGTATLIVAAVLPDIDGACYLSSPDAAFGFRRGWTHGILAWFVLPLVVTGAMLAFDRFVRRRRRPDLAPVQSGPVLLLAVLGVLTHPALDWVNNYGIRLWMPISDRWFYGDALFIVDPWLWLMLGSAVALAWTRTRTGSILVGLASVAMTALLWSTPVVPVEARLTWAAGIVGWLALRWSLPAGRVTVAARVALVVAALYIGVNVAGSRLAESRVRDLARRRGWNADRIAAMPQPADPASRTVIAVTPDRYWFVPVNLLWPTPEEAPVESVSRGSFDPIVAAALEAPGIQGVRSWLRFPSYEVQSRPDGGHRVLVRDARFAVGRRPGFGVVAVVDLDRTLKPVER